MAQNIAHESVQQEWGPPTPDEELASFNGRIALLISGEIQPLGDELIAMDDDPDGGNHAILHPDDIPPHISSIALKPPNLEPLVTVTYDDHDPQADRLAYAL